LQQSVSTRIVYKQGLLGAFGTNPFLDAILADTHPFVVLCQYQTDGYNYSLWSLCLCGWTGKTDL